MKTSKKLSFSEKVVRRNRILTLVLILMIIYMIVVGELGLGDSRNMTRLAELTGRILFFGGMIRVIVRIMQNRKLLGNRLLLKEKMREETDEMNIMIYEKSGGVVWDAVLICQLFLTLTTSLMNMAAFYSAFATLVILIAAKTVRFLYLKYNGV